MYVYIGGLLHICKKILKDVFIEYVDRYETLNILFRYESQYYLEDNEKENCLKMTSNWMFHMNEKEI